MSHYLIPMMMYISKCKCHPMTDSYTYFWGEGRGRRWSHSHWPTAHWGTVMPAEWNNRSPNHFEWWDQWPQVSSTSWIDFMEAVEQTTFHWVEECLYKEHTHLLGSIPDPSTQCHPHRTHPPAIPYVFPGGGPIETVRWGFHSTPQAVQWSEHDAGQG